MNPIMEVRLTGSRSCKSSFKETISWNHQMSLNIQEHRCITINCGTSICEANKHWVHQGHRSHIIPGSEALVTAVLIKTPDDPAEFMMKAADSSLLLFSSSFFSCCVLNLFPSWQTQNGGAWTGRASSIKFQQSYVQVVWSGPVSKLYLWSWASQYSVQ